MVKRVIRRKKVVEVEKEALVGEALESVVSEKTPRGESRVPEIMSSIHHGKHLNAWPALTKTEKSELKAALDAESLSEMTPRFPAREQAREWTRKELEAL